LAKNQHLFGLDIGKIKICSDKMETDCHLEIKVFFSSWKRWLFEGFWDFAARGKDDLQNFFFLQKYCKVTAA